MGQVLAVLLFAANPTLSAEVPEPEPVEDIRFHGELSLLGAGGFTGVPSLGAGGGLHVELGFVLASDSVVSARASFATSVMLNVMQFGVSYAHRFAQRFTLGVGATWGGVFGIIDMPGALTVQAPVRFTWKLGDHARRGFVFGAEIAPGIAYRGSAGLARRTVTLPAISLIGQLTFGYAFW